MNLTTVSFKCFVSYCFSAVKRRRGSLQSIFKVLLHILSCFETIPSERNFLLSLYRKTGPFQICLRPKFSCTRSSSQFKVFRQRLRIERNWHALYREEITDELITYLYNRLFSPGSGCNSKPKRKETIIWIVRPVH